MPRSSATIHGAIAIGRCGPINTTRHPIIGSRAPACRKAQAGGGREPTLHSQGVVMVRYYPVLFLATLALLGSAKATNSQSANLEGSWSASGSIAFASGSREHARCRVQYAQRSATSYR